MVDISNILKINNEIDNELRTFNRFIEIIKNHMEISSIMFYYDGLRGYDRYRIIVYVIESRLNFNYLDRIFENIVSDMKDLGVNMHLILNVYMKEDRNELLRLFSEHIENQYCCSKDKIVGEFSITKEFSGCVGDNILESCMIEMVKPLVVIKRNRGFVRDDLENYFDKRGYDFCIY